MKIKAGERKLKIVGGKAAGFVVFEKDTTCKLKYQQGVGAVLVVGSGPHRGIYLHVC